jgi:hypothetical protein
MALREIDDSGRTRDILKLPYEHDFNQIWLRIRPEERTAIEAEINRWLDELISSPNPEYGSITNTSIEGGRLNPETGIRGDWRGTVFQSIFEACNENEVRAGMICGNVWKRVIIEREEMWVGIRPDPTFRNRGINLGGKTYFLDRSR